VTLFVGLTGSIGMGKTTTAALFRDEGCPVHDADAVVHALYAGEAVPAVEAAFPGVVHDGVVDRVRLAAALAGRPEAFARLEAIVHPLVQAREEAFRAACRRAGAPVAILDIPLLFETGAERRCDAVVVVSAPADVQEARVLARPGMTRDRLAAILARQMPDADKRARADFVVDTGQGLDAARAQVRAILATLKARVTG
jgi:dephospho-CoA kinase